MWMEQRRQAMLQLHRSDGQFYRLLRCAWYYRFYGIIRIMTSHFQIKESYIHTWITFKIVDDSFKWWIDMKHRIYLLFLALFIWLYSVTYINMHIGSTFIVLWMFYGYFSVNVCKVRCLLWYIFLWKYQRLLQHMNTRGVHKHTLDSKRLTLMGFKLGTLSLQCICRYDSICDIK